MMRDEINDIVIRIHDLARELEASKHWVFGKELRNLADRLARVHKYHDLTAEEQFAYDYVKATHGIDIRGVDDV